MVLQFGRDICGNLATAETREWLVTNGIGGYACGTIAGLLSRHYHGLLNATLKPPVDRTLLLAKLDEVATYDGERYELSCDRWADGTIAPHGYRYIERFSLDGTIPTWQYAFEDALLIKQIWMEQGANTTFVRYRLQRGSVPVQLRLKALVNYRNHHHSTYSQAWDMQLEAVTGGIRVAAFEEAVPFYILGDRGLSRHRTVKLFPDRSYSRKTPHYFVVANRRKNGSVLDELPTTIDYCTPIFAEGIATSSL